MKIYEIEKSDPSQSLHKFEVFLPYDNLTKRALQKSEQTNMNFALSSNNNSHLKQYCNDLDKKLFIITNI